MFSISPRPADKLFLGIAIALIGAGFLIFMSASVGLIARSGPEVSSVAFRQIAAVLIGAALLYIVSRVDYRLFKRMALPFFLLSIAASALVFIPGIGVEYGGARRWIAIGFLTFQPSELLKFGLIVYAAAFLSAVRERAQTARLGLVPVAALLAIAAAILLPQPDTDSFIIIALAALGMFFAAGGTFRHFAVVCLVGIIGLSSLVMVRPYLKERISTFLNPAADPQNTGYQIQQSLIAIGSGGLLGRGFGQSVQKFSYLPEPMNDSIFAVAGEEFGFVGTTLLIVLFVGFVLRGFRIAARSPDRFGGLLALGIVILIGASAFINMASMLALIPLSGLPLSFVSQGGTALLVTLFEVGVVLNISRFQKN